jgi:hypothetical protein
MQKFFGFLFFKKELLFYVEDKPMRKTIKYLTPLLLLLGAAGGDGTPSYTADGNLVPPPDYRSWVFLTSGIDMSYSAAPPMAGQSMFNNIFVNPAAWQGFQQTGHWPDKTVLVIENRGANSHGSINKHGQYQTEDLMGMEFHVRDTARFKAGWGFFAVTTPGTAKFMAYTEDCYACHQAHGAVDTTFTQFYPMAKPIAVKAGTYREDKPDAH